MHRATDWTRFSLCLLAIVGIVATVAFAQETTDVLEALEAELIPEYGAQTQYGIRLDLRNTAQFIDWYYEIELSVDEASIKDQALGALVAPCCDDNSAATCCCECNLTRSVWGLSAHLIRETGYGIEAVRDAAFEWLRFSRPDYYLAAALEEEGLDPQSFGLTTYGSCYRGICNYPVTEGGCAGMTDLVMPDIATLPEVTLPEDNECLDDVDLSTLSLGLVSPSEAFAFIEADENAGNFILLDVQTRGEYSGGHLDGAINLNYYMDGFSSVLESIDRNLTYVIYCKSGGRSGNAAALMQDLGFCCVSDIDGGVLAWAESGFPLVSD